MSECACGEGVGVSVCVCTCMTLCVSLWECACVTVCVCVDIVHVYMSLCKVVIFMFMKMYGAIPQCVCKIGQKKDRNPSSPSKTSPSSPSQSTSPVGVSPGRRVGLRTECIDQLKKWHALLVDGAITKAQYDFQAKILNDMKKF